MRRRGLGAVAVLVLVVAGCSGSDGGGPASERTGPTSTNGARSSTTAAPFSCAPPEAGRRTVTVDGVARTFDVAVPARFRSAAPVVVLFHGYGSTGEQIGDVTGLATSGPKAGVVVVTPLASGSPTSWRIVAGFAADRAFVDALLDDLGASDCIDPARVWLAGFSAGSGFAGVYGCTTKRPLAGLVLASGLPPALCPEDHTPRVLVTNGTADRVVAYDGGGKEVNGAIVDLASVPESVAGWAARAGCPGGPTDAGVGADVRVSSWGGCERGGPVDLVTVEGGGHAWPGGSQQAVAGGVTTQTVSLSCVVLGLVAAADAKVEALAQACPGDHPDLARPGS